MSASTVKKASRFLSLVLRHDPARAGIVLDAAGWTPVPDLLAALARRGMAITFDDLVHIVETNDKRRFAFNPDRSLIRASQGHSLPVDLGYGDRAPPETLYHGTVARFLPAIRAQGLVPGQRHDVHLSPDADTARRVGARRGDPVVLRVDAGAMHRDGFAF
ncbi:RNA 2'-phosphotransferase, partial [bacterium]|nr:RNA 2'-phosphotransferase [bacterium]